MDWVTPQEAKQAGRESLEAAILCSRKHWWQLETCTREEFIEAYKKYKDDLVKDVFCALCHRKKYLGESCRGSKCVLDDGQNSDTWSSCCKEYQAFNRWYQAFNHWRGWNMFNLSPENFAIFQTVRARAIRERLDREYEKLIGQPVFMPKRGDVIEVADCKDDAWEKRIFLPYIEGAFFSWLVVNPQHEERFKKGEKFAYHSFKYVRPVSKICDKCGQEIKINPSQAAQNLKTE